MGNLPFGIDVCRWDGKINWDRTASNPEPVRFAGIRATISDSYVDSWFKNNWSEAKRVGIFRAAYHVLYPGTSAEKQMDHFCQTVGNDFGELPLVLDIELDQNQSINQINTVILRCTSIIKERTGRSPILYSRASWVDIYITGGNNPPAWLNDYDWWLAQYLRTPQEHPGPPDLPKGVVRERCLIHQTADHGTPIGTESKQMDYDRWQFGQAHLEKYTKSKVTLTLEEKVEILWEAHPELHKS